MGIAEYHGPRSQMMRCIDYPTMLKDGSGFGAMAGVSAAFLAKDGFTGAPALTIENEEKFSGCTVHEVNSKLDSGKIILQERVKISSKETPKSLAKKILKVEHKVYPYAIKKIFSP